ncbi:hypothetical protein ES703_117459 [subsurface metagenome]
MAKKKEFASEAEFQKHITQKGGVAHEIAQFFHKKRVFKDTSAGAGDAEHPVKLNSSGQVDKTMMPPIVLKDNAEVGRKFYVSDSAPGGGDGDNGDLWFEY